MQEKIQAEIIQDFEREIVGLEDGGDIIVNCRSCNKPLFKVVCVRQTPVKIKWGTTQITLTSQKFVSNCPYCDSKSWTKKFSGTLVYTGIDDETIITNIAMSDPIDGEVTNELEVERYEN